MHRAQMRLRRAVAAGKIPKLDACDRCGSGPTEAHHHNGYGDHWWDVQWLCRSCHALAESEIREANRIADPDESAPLSIVFVGDWP